jgi:uncharacterized protein (TIGR02271 family)
MGDTNALRVVGKDGLQGTLLSALPTGKTEPVRIVLDTGELIEVPASILHPHSPGILQVELGPEDLNRHNSEIDGSEIDRAPGSAVVPVLAEELQVGRKAVPTGSVRVHRAVREHEQTVDIPLLKEHVDVRRVLIEQEVNGPLPVRQDGNTTIIPIVEEVLVVSKKFMLKEEVHVLRTVREERYREQITVSRQEPEIQRIDASGRVLSVDVPAVRPEAPIRSTDAPLTPQEKRVQRPRKRSVIADVYRKP